MFVQLLLCACVSHLQLCAFTRAHMLKNKRVAYTFSYKIPVEDVGRLKALFMNRNEFPQIKGYDCMILHKADVKVPAAQVRAKNVEAVVSQNYGTCLLHCIVCHTPKMLVASLVNVQGSTCLLLFL